MGAAKTQGPAGRHPWSVASLTRPQGSPPDVPDRAPVV